MLAATSGVVRAAIAASSTSSVERLAGSGCILTWMSGLSAFHASTILVAKSISSGFDDGQKVIVVWARAEVATASVASKARESKPTRRVAAECHLTGCATFGRAAPGLAAAGRSTPGCLGRAGRRRILVMNDLLIPSLHSR